MAGIKPGYHRTVLNHTQWDVPQRYQELNWIGAGAFSQVCKAYDNQTGRMVAIKKLTRPFQSELDANRIYREICILRHLDHENIVPLLDMFSSACKLGVFNDLYLVTTFNGYNLHSIMNFIPMSQERIQFFMYQILRGLKYIHSAGIIHRDLKPQNIVVNEDNEVKIVDFGLARQVDNSMTGYVSTRWYRAPEILYNWMHYTAAVDIWSAGCIMAELILKKPLFPGTDCLDLFNRIIRVIGTPSKDIVSKITSHSAKAYIQSLPFAPRMDFKGFLGPKTPPSAVDLLEKMLNFDPQSRITAAEALGHPNMSDWSDPDDEPVCEKPFDSSCENLKLDISGWRKLIFSEVLNFNPPAFMDTT
jgi:p38 MAP kinase